MFNASLQKQLKKYLNNNEISVLEKICKRQELEEHFFRTKSDVKWFHPLRILGYFKPEKSPRPIPADKDGFFTIPQWNVLPYLEKISLQVKTPKNKKYTEELLKIIKNVSHYKDPNGQKIDNTRTWWFFVKILVNLPTNKTPNEIINLIPLWLDSKFGTSLQGSDIVTELLPRFLTNSPTDLKKAEKIIDFVTSFKSYQLNQERAKLLGKEEESRMVVEPFWLKEFFDKYSENIGEKCSSQVIINLGSKIRKLLRYKEDGTYESFYEEMEHLREEPLEILTYILKRIFTSKAKINVEETRIILKKFLSVGDFHYFPKMAIYVIAQEIEKYADVFWERLEEDNASTILYGISFGDELKHLLKNLKNLTIKQRELFEKRIEEVPKSKKATDNTPLEFFKQQRYQALAADPYFNDLYIKNKEITKTDAFLSPAIGKIETKWGFGSSPLTKEDILKMSNKELATFLAKFETNDFWDGPSVDGLSDLLKNVAKEHPEKFIDDLGPFLSTDYLYVYDILSSLSNAWNEKRAFNWAKLLDFIEIYINRDEFWQNKLQVVKGSHWKADCHWVVGMIGELIQSGTKNDDWSFEQECLPIAQNIILYIIDKLSKNREGINTFKDPITEALNTASGKIITALIFISIHIANLREKEKEIKWQNELQNSYDNLLNEQVVEAYTLFGKYMPNFYYLNKIWVQQKIEQMKSTNENCWQAFMSGYLCRNVYQNLYEIMKINGHYSKALSSIFPDTFGIGINERLIQHISIAYLHDIENLSEQGLFVTLLKKWNVQEIKEIIGFFWMQRDYLVRSIRTDIPVQNTDEKEKSKNKIIEFWKWLYGKYKDLTSLSENDEEILSAVSKLTVFLPNINPETFQWLKLSAQHVHLDFDAPFFIECLDELKNKGDRYESGNYVGRIFLEMLKTFTPDYDQKHIRSIVQYLYENQDTENMAKEIYETYLKRGFEFLKDIHEMNKNIG